MTRLSNGMTGQKPASPNNPSSVARSKSLRRAQTHQTADLPRCVGKDPTLSNKFRATINQHFFAGWILCASPSFLSYLSPCCFHPGESVLICEMHLNSSFLQSKSLSI